MLGIAAYCRSTLTIFHPFTQTDGMTVALMVCTSSRPTGSLEIKRHRMYIISSIKDDVDARVLFTYLPCAPLKISQFICVVMGHCGTTHPARFQLIDFCSCSPPTDPQ